MAFENIGVYKKYTPFDLTDVLSIESFVDQRYNIPSKCKNLVITCLANYQTTPTWSEHWGDYFDFDVNRTVHLGLIDTTGWFKKLENFLAYKDNHAFIILPQKNQLPKYKNLTYIEMPEFYGSYYDFFKFNSEEITFDHQVEKHFLFLSKRTQFDRQVLFYNLVKNSLHSGNYVSFLGENGERTATCLGSMRGNHKLIQDNFLSLDLPLDVITNMVPYRSYPEFLGISDNFGTNGGWINSSKLFQNSFMSIVAESFVDQPNDPIFTEKIFKPIWNFRPFIVSASAGALEYLKTIGFKTFNRWIDESYDNEHDKIKRLIKINAEINRLSKLTISECCNMLKDMEETLLHNRQNFSDLSFKFNDRKNQIDSLIQQHIDTSIK